MAILFDGDGKLEVTKNLKNKYDGSLAFIDSVMADIGSISDDMTKVYYKSCYLEDNK